MQSGKLDRLITIQSFTTSPDTDTAEPIKTWAAITNGTNVPAQWVNERGGEVWEAAKDDAQTIGYFRIRWLGSVATAMAGLTEKMRIVFEGRYYEIYHIVEEGRRQWLKLFVTAFPVDE